MARIWNHFRNKKRTKAQGMVEFALALPILLLLVLGIIEFGRLMLTYSAVYSASREAARYAVGEEMSVNGVPHYQDCGEIKANGVRVGSFGGVQANDIEIRYDDGLREIPLDWAVLNRCDGDVDSGVNIKLGDRVLVRVTTAFDPIVPIVNLPGFDVTSTSVRTFLSAIDVRGTPLPTSTRVASFTPTNTATPTDTPTPSDTPTITLTVTPGPSPTPTDTLTPTISPLPSDTPTITTTPTNTQPATFTPTPTLTNTPAVDCRKMSFLSNSIVMYQDTFFASIKNGTSDTTHVRNIRVVWPDPDLHLNLAVLGTFDWTGSSGPAWSVSFPYGEVSYGPQMFSNQVIQLSLDFDRNYNTETQRPYVEIAFENNCMIKWPENATPYPTWTPTPTITMTPTPSATVTVTSELIIATPTDDIQGAQ